MLEKQTKSRWNLHLCALRVNQLDISIFQWVSHFSLGLMEQAKFFSFGTWIFWFWYTCQNKFICWFIMHLFLNYHSFYIKQDFKILYNYCLSQLNLYTGWCTTIQGTGYLANNLDKSLLMAQTKQKMIFWFFLSAHLPVSAMRKLVTSFLERTGAMLFIDVTTETKNLFHQKK